MSDPTFLYGIGGYSAKLAHVFGAIIWLGGVLFMAGVATPILKYYADPAHRDERVAEVVGWLERRLVGFSWLGLGAVVVSGIVLSIFAPSFELARLASFYDWVLHLKIAMLVPIVLVNYLLSVSYRELAAARASREAGEELAPGEIVSWRIVMLRRVNIYLAFAILLLISTL
ncbi:MAG TPA: hypothetical protein VNA88_00065 [Candidatus Kapabacteria bacterium]|jgi:uncharacterized membrane protein|nr:hypothetical protein [Candidatus Kapabacteria bacterium]